MFVSLQPGLGPIFQDIGLNFCPTLDFLPSRHLIRAYTSTAFVSISVWFFFPWFIVQNIWNKKYSFIYHASRVHTAQEGTYSTLFLFLCFCLRIRGDLLFVISVYYLSTQHVPTICVSIIEILVSFYDNVFFSYLIYVSIIEIVVLFYDNVFFVMCL